jgi:Family of unknown function (DUF5675)
VKLFLERLQVDPDVTIGSLSIDDQFEAWTCEDPVREIEGQPVANWKVFGKTAIPRGTYSIDITYSPHFKMPLPLLLKVPGFDGVRIHSGNTPADTEGCLLVGQDRLGKSIGKSRLAFTALFAKLTSAKARGEPITIEIV